MKQVLRRIGLLLLLLSTFSPARSAEPEADFLREVQPILTKHCATCHGPDQQKGGLRLDRRADALAGGDSGKLFVPRKPSESLLIHRVNAIDDSKMPPKGDRLTDAELKTLKAWIEQGAKWPDDGMAAAKPTDWWSFQPVKKPALNLDELVRAKLKEKKLVPSPEADHRTLVRRIYFDLIGLPPTPKQIEEFVTDKSPNAWEKLVDQLLASPQYGERWARHWLDVVHFGETHGYDKDQPRPNAWRYRDYVIRAFNQDKPYSRFLKEQLAGDVLYPGTVDGIEALGFLAAGPWDLIGHTEVPETKIDGKIARHLDRDDFVANTISTFLGLTVHCAQCHNHKFDPISHEDYYRLQAVFAGIDRIDYLYDTDPDLAKKRRELESKKLTAANRVKAILDEAAKRAGTDLASLDRKILEAKKLLVGAKQAEYGYHSAIATKQETVKWVQIDLGISRPFESVILRTCDDDFNMIGAGFGFPVRFKIESSDDPKFEAGITLISDETGKDYPNPKSTTYRTTTKASGRYLRITATKLAPRLNDFIFALSEVEVLDAKGVKLSVGQPVTALDSIEAPDRWAKVNLTDGKFPADKVSPLEYAELLARRDATFKTALGERGIAELAAAEAEEKAVDAELSTLTGQRRRAYIATVHTGSGNFVGTGANGTPRTIRVLPRGDVTKPGKEVPAGGLGFLGGHFELKPNHKEGDRRAALAHWIADVSNPLTYRVMANRVWQYHFARGLVDTPNDFGKMGQLPTHPELLDLLATELQEHQSIKKLHKRILMSETYKQSSATNEANAKIDIDNRFLWRQNRHKLEAEAVRDSILAVAGKLDLTMGGPSFQDFVVEKPEHSPHYQYHLHDPADIRSHRRAVYRFVVRSQQQPFLAALDCADPSMAVEKRNESISPQQALALLNNKLALAMAAHFAARVEKMGNNEEERTAAAFELALGRKPTPNELSALANHARAHGMANTCRAILNLNEFVFVD